MPSRPRLLTPAQALERERKLLARKERNRASAALHRERKNQTIDTLTQRVDELLTENRRLKALASENRELRAALAELKKSKESIATLSPLNPSPQLSTKTSASSKGFLLRIPLVPTHVVCHDSNPQPAVYAY